MKRALKISPRRAAGAGCLVVLLLLCMGAGLVAAALRAGPAGLGLPGGSVLRAGSDDFVLSNYSFQTGTTYFLDLNGNGVRNILEVHRLADSGGIEVVFHHATKEAQNETRLLTLRGP